MAKIVACVSGRAGEGKTSTAFHLADYLAKYGQTVLLDATPEKHALDLLRHRSHLPRFSIMEASRGALERRATDYVVLDTPTLPSPANLHGVAQNSDLMVWTLRSPCFSLESILAFVALSPALAYKIRVLWISTSRELQQDRGVLSRRSLLEAGIASFKTVLCPTSILSKAFATGQSVREIETGALVWRQYKNLGDEIRSLLRSGAPSGHRTSHH